MTSQKDEFVNLRGVIRYLERRPIAKKELFVAIGGF